VVVFMGDIHGNPARVLLYSEYLKLTENDIIVLLGDVGMNYDGDSHDRFAKKQLASVPATVLCIHGNHENRPQNIDTYKEAEFNGGKVLVEDEFPNLLFAVDGEIYNLEGKKAIAIGGAYSVDKYYRLERGYGWWEDEQPSPEIKAKVESVLESNTVDIVMSHTCPFKYIPREMFLPGIDQSGVDNGTELWLDRIEDKIDYEAWFCGHWHTDKRIDKMHFLFKDYECYPRLWEE